MISGGVGANRLSKKRFHEKRAVFQPPGDSTHLCDIKRPRQPSGHFGAAAAFPENITIQIKSRPDKCSPEIKPASRGGLPLL